MRRGTFNDNFSNGGKLQSPESLLFRLPVVALIQARGLMAAVHELVP